MACRYPSRTSVGLPGRRRHVGFVGDNENCTLVEALAGARAVIFVKTNLSIGCLYGETINKYGYIHTLCLANRQAD